MRKGKRILCLLLAALFALTCLAGCHGSKKRNSFAVPENFDTEKQHEIVFWAKNDTNKTQVEIYKKAILDFQKIYPNISVTLKLYTDYGRIYQDVLTNISTDTTPNVCITYPDHIATYKTGQDVVVVLDDLLTDERFGLGGSEVRFDSPEPEEVVPEFLNECYIDGDLYALPFMRSTEACFVNVTLLEKLGYTLPDILTWDFVWEVSEKAMEQDSAGNYKVNGQKVMIPFIYKSTDNMMISMLRQLDAPYSDENGNVLLFNDTTKELLLEITEHARSGSLSTFKIASYPANYLNAGQNIFSIDSTAGATWMGSDAPLLDIPEDQVVRFETAVRIIPQFDPENPQMISQGPSVCIFNKKDPQEVLASWLFAQFLISNDVQTAYAETEGYVPVTLKAQNSEEYRDYLSRAGEDNDKYYDIKIEATQLLMENTGNTFVTPVFNGSASVRDAAGQLIEEAVKSVRRKKTVDDAYIEQLFEEMVSLKHLDQIETSSSSGKKDLGPLPNTAVTLLVCLACAWVLIGIYALWTLLRKRARK